MSVPAHREPLSFALPARDQRAPIQPVIRRPIAAGKFLSIGHDKLWVRGVTYGTFRPGPDGHSCGTLETAARDFAAINKAGFNTVRTYTVPPRWFLDLAHAHGLFVMVGVPWEQHVAFLDDRERARDIVRRVRSGVQTCASHPAILCYAVGNEIPSGIVRWLGRARVERFLTRLVAEARDADPEALVTYVNYPSTEYLEVPEVDLVSFNVYLEHQDRLEDYLARLQNLAGERPLLMTEIGLDSLRHGEDVQAQVLEWQVRTAFAAGCAGAFVFAWTDEWHRGGGDIEDWDFGLTRRDRSPKPALDVVRDALADLPVHVDAGWPSVSVVVCSYNGSRTIRDCLKALQRLDYPDYEVIVVDDGSRDRTAAIARSYRDVRVISTPNRGLSNARNTGLAAATGDIVAYIDDDAYPDPHWLTYLVATFQRTGHVGVGGPNIAPPGDGPIAECVANAPGGPVHVLLEDQLAEHIPGCNMAFRRAALEAIGGFDPQFRTAGDDVDVCWRLQEHGGTLGFHAGAMVWHHRRNSLRAYWRQQVGYGRAEALLERKWPEKYNGVGHLAWRGRLYGRGLTQGLHCMRQRIYHGQWGSAPFQSVYEPAPGTLGALSLMPEWYLLLLVLAGLSILGTAWRPLLMTWPLLALGVGASVGQAVLSAARATLPRDRGLRWRGLTALLHLVQPLARLTGRLRHGLTPWRRHGARDFVWPWRCQRTLWSERWRPAAEWVAALEDTLQTEGARIARGGNFDRWDLTVHRVLATVRVLLAVEEHGGGHQLVRLRIWPVPSVGHIVFVGFAALGVTAAVQGAWLAAALLALAGGAGAVRIVREAGTALHHVLRAAETLAPKPDGATTNEPTA
ncbi:MAG: glycosyl transferase [Candidatus Rokuibacteriota bacterium]|nr:MAG: glycosyl transferase [Candidatus Rokubacteria bacterium]